MTTRLSSNLSDNLMKRVGADQHLEIAGFIREADKSVLDAKAGETVRNLWSKSPWTVESNLDLVNWPDRPTWYEMPGLPKNLGEGDQAVLGFLILPHPAVPGLYQVVTCFETAEIAARHCYAMAYIDVASLSDNAVRARRFYSKIPTESAERIMMQIGVSISDDFRDELMIMEDDREEVIDAVMRDATADVPILLAILVAAESENAFLLDLNQPDHHRNLKGMPLRRRHLPGRWADKLERRLSSGIVRIPRAAKKPRLVAYA